MSGETERSVSPWTVDTLMVHMTALLEGRDLLQEERDRRYTERFDAQETALGERSKALADRLDTLNELRDDVATTAEVEAVKTMLTDVKERLAAIDGAAAGVRLSRGDLLSAVSLAVIVLGLIIAGANYVTTR